MFESQPPAPRLVVSPQHFPPRRLLQERGTKSSRQRTQKNTRPGTLPRDCSEDMNSWGNVTVSAGSGLEPTDKGREEKQIVKPLPRTPLRLHQAFHSHKVFSTVTTECGRRPWGPRGQLGRQDTVLPLQITAASSCPGSCPGVISEVRVTVQPPQQSLRSDRFHSERSNLTVKGSPGRVPVTVIPTLGHASPVRHSGRTPADEPAVPRVIWRRSPTVIIPFVQTVLI